MNQESTPIPKAPLPAAEKRRRKREIVIIAAIIPIVALLTFVENRVVHFGGDVPIPNSTLMFILININLLLLLLLIFLVFRNLVKLLYDRKRRVLGARLRTRLVVAFVTLTLIPTIVLFFFSINFITTSIAFWFSAPVEQALENSLDVGRQLYRYTEETNRFYQERIAYQIQDKNLLEPEQLEELSRYIRVVQRAFNLDAVELYTPNAVRLTYALAPELEHVEVKAISADQLKSDMGPSGVRSISESISSGELLRTIGTIPAGVAPAEASALIVLTILIPPDLSEKMASISRGYEEYQQIKMLKRPLQITYYITLSVVALLVVFCAIWFGFYLAKTISIPIMELAEGTRRVAEGDLGVTIHMPVDDEIGSLVDAFNSMTRDLRIGREALERSANKLQEQYIEIEERRRYMEIVLKNVSAGVITLDAEGVISTINKSAEKMLSLKVENILNKRYKEVLPERYLKIADDVMETLFDSIGDSVEFPLRITVEGKPKSFLIYISALKDDADNHMGIVMVFDDLTELEKAERMAAWREVARRIAHEVKNPLTPISLSAQRLKRKYSARLNDPVFDECTGMIIDHVELIRNLVNEFSFFARFPAASPKPEAILPIIEETVALYREGHKNIEFAVNAPEDIPELSLDRQQIKQAMINLVENAIGAIRGEANITITVTPDPILKKVRIEVADTGEGISDKAKTRLFEPNFSTKKAGMGLGLTIVNTIIAGHQGTISVQDNHPCGAKFVIELPV